MLHWLSTALWRLEKKEAFKTVKKGKEGKKKKESFAPDLDQLERHRLALTETAVGQNRRKKAKISMSFLVISYFNPGQIVQDKTSSAVKNSVKSVAPDQFCRIVFWITLLPVMLINKLSIQIIIIIFKGEKPINLFRITKIPQYSTI